MRCDTGKLFEEITAKIVDALKKGRRPWIRPWRLVGRPIRYNGVAFTGLNSLILLTAADENGYESRYWLTPAQGKRCGGELREDQMEMGTRVLRPVIVPLPSWALHHPSFAKQPRVWKHRDGERVRVHMRPYIVFNADQFDRLPPRFRAKDAGQMRLDEEERIHRAERFFRAIDAKVENGGDKACYRPSDDLVEMPHFRQFKDRVAYYATLAHELVHWTGHGDRLNRDSLNLYWSDVRIRALEELVAELGAAFVLGVLDLASDPREDQKAYVASWIRELEEDPRAIERVTDYAETAANYLTVAAAAWRVDELAKRRFHSKNYPVVYVDVLKIRTETILVAVGVSDAGFRHLLGVAQGDQEDRTNFRHARNLVLDLVRRGLYPDQARLFVTGGSPTLRRAIRSRFGRSLVQHCHSTFVAAVLSALKPKQPADEQGDLDSADNALPRARVTEKLRGALLLGEQEGEPRLLELADSLERQDDREAADVLRERLTNLFTVAQLEPARQLRRALTTTHWITRAESGFRSQICAPPTWRDPQATVEWAVASFLRAERDSLDKGVRISGWRSLRPLVDRLLGNLGGESSAGQFTPVPPLRAAEHAGDGAGIAKSGRIEKHAHPLTVSATRAARPTAHQGLLP